MEAEASESRKRIQELMPNRHEVRLFIWNELNGPLTSDLDQFVKSHIKDYGSWKEKHRANGQLAFKGWIYRKKKQGHWLYFYKNGKPHKDCYYRNSEYHGTCTIWDVDGNYEVCEYYKGKRHGERLRFDAQGVLFQKWVYHMGRYKEFYGPIELGLK